ncbi:hypothetical protein WN55_05656, partial [Dufourea novaeangliae]
NEGISRQLIVEYTPHQRPSGSTYTPFELHIPRYQFCGPGTRLQERLARGDRGVMPLNAACKEHDIAYSQRKDLQGRHDADKILAEISGQRVTAADASFGEKAAASAMWAAMKVKTKLGMGLKRNRRGRRRSNPIKNSTKKKYNNAQPRILQAAKRSGFLPFLLPALSAIGALTGGAAGVVKAVNDAKAARKQLEKAQRHNRAMQGRGLYLAPYKHGKGLKKKKHKKHLKLKHEETVHNSTTDVQLKSMCNGLPYFRGVFMRNDLPKKTWLNECVSSI